MSNGTSTNISDHMEGDIHKIIAFLQTLAKKHPDATVHHEVHDDAYDEAYGGTHLEVLIEVIYGEVP